MVTASSDPAQSPEHPLPPEVAELARELGLETSDIENPEVASCLRRLGTEPTCIPRAELQMLECGPSDMRPLLEARYRHRALPNSNSSDPLSVGGVAVPTVADTGGATSLSGESAALCTVCDHPLTDVAIRACSVRDCPNAQKDAA